MTDAAPRIGAIIVAAGSGVRFGASDKVFANLAGRPVLAWSLDRFAGHPRIARVVVVLGDHTQEAGARIIADRAATNVSTCLGGATRSASVRAGLAQVTDCDIVLIHDAARPLVTDRLIDAVIDTTIEHGAAVPVLQVSDTLHIVDQAGFSTGVVDRTLLRAAQTPQGSRTALLERAFGGATASTDEGGMLLAAGIPVALVDGETTNIKITWADDIALAEALLAARRERA
jgi:2-C-methyl-D-erythritol 4-phosphate cytidylyltransferase